ncbi:MAG: ERCC4 domain-containing protein [Methylacidiphilales bacterium]|nr:ERCC4 domain-containing protein [Candidatus Methylacidiphilales bacterium]
MEAIEQPDIDSGLNSSKTVSPDEIQVEIDHRERPSGLVEAFTAHSGVQVSVSELPIGDVCVDTRLVVERKTLADLERSIVDQRLFSQALRLARVRDGGAVPLIVLQGKIAEGAVSREAVQGALVTLTLVFGLPVLRSWDVAETARLCLYAGRQLRSAATGEGLVRGGYRPRKRRRRQLYILQGLPGIGPERAGRIAGQIRQCGSCN